ncbi:MAG: acetylxylan esterase [bacterium]
MRKISIAAGTCLAAAFVIRAVPCAAKDAGAMAPSTTFFEYERRLPVRADVVLKEEKPGVKTFRVVYTSANGERVPAYFYVPSAGSGPYPCVIMMHGGGGSKEDIAIAYDFFAMRGIAVFAPDAAMQGERRVEGVDALTADPYTMRHIFIQTVLDLRRAVDWLETRGEVDAGRIGYLGVSMGAMIGSVFAAVEERVRAAALIVGGADFGAFLAHSQTPPLIMLRNFAQPEEIGKIAGALAVIDPQYYVGAIAPRPVFLMNGTGDLIVSREAGERMHELAGEPKESHWYEGSHIPPFDRVLLLTSGFFKKHLKGKKAAAAKTAGAPAAAPRIEYGVARDFSDPAHRIAVLTAWTAEPIPPGVSLAVAFPEITPVSLPLYDDGTHGDESAGDGVWTFRFDLGAHAPALNVVGGEKLYTTEIRAVAADGTVLASTGAGILTGTETNADMP